MLGVIFYCIQVHTEVVAGMKIYDIPVVTGNRYIIGGNNIQYLRHRVFGYRCDVPTGHGFGGVEIVLRSLARLAAAH